jgi:hypothetical protein
MFARGSNGSTWLEDEEVQSKRRFDPGQHRRVVVTEVEQRASAVKTSAPTNVTMNAGLMIARSIDWKAATKVRSSVRRSPGMIALL